MLNILLAGTAIGLLATVSRAFFQRQGAQQAAADTLSAGQAMTRQIAGRRVILERALSSLGDSQAEVLYHALPQLRARLEPLANFSVDAVSDPKLPALCAHKRRRIAPAARALYGMAGTGAGGLRWLSGGPAAARMLGVTLPQGAQALLDGTATQCTEDDVAALRRLSAALLALRTRCGESQKALQQLRRRLAEQSADLRIVVRNNANYRSLSSYPLPGQLRSPRAVIHQTVHTAQALTAAALTPLRTASDEQPQPARTQPAAAPTLLALATAR